MSLGNIGTFYSKSGKQVVTSSKHSEMGAIYSLALDIVYVVYMCEDHTRMCYLWKIIRLS
jgi:hypothetical protein